MEYIAIKDVAKNLLVECINSAFSDYVMPIHLTEDTLDKFFEASCIDTDLSFCALLNDKIIGFILNASGLYNGERVVFDAGTGVLPEYRGKGVFTGLFRYTEDNLRLYGINKYYLEVLQQNERAINLYKRNGFSIVRSLSVMKSEKHLEGVQNTDVKIFSLSKFNFADISNYTVVAPSFEHSSNIIQESSHLYAVVYDKAFSAFCIFYKDDGRIIQLGYKDITKLREIIAFLLSKYKCLIAKNIDTSYSLTIETLKSIGFSEIARQYEMVKVL